MCIYIRRLYTYKYYKLFVAEAPHLKSITFEHQADYLLWVIGKLIHSFHEKQYLFAAQCSWWLAAIVGLQPVLVYYLDNQRFPSAANTDKLPGKEKSTVPRNIQSNMLQDSQYPGYQRQDLLLERTEAYIQVSENARKEYISDPLRRTRKGQDNPLPKSKTQLKKARKQQCLTQERNQRFEKNWN